MPKDKTGSGTGCDIAAGSRTFRGERFTASTDNGIPLYVWVPAGGQFADSCYFCHGLSLGTYKRYGYSVFSTSVWNVLHDEYEFLGFDHGGTPQDLQVGDVIAWFAVAKGVVKKTPDITDGDMGALPAGDISIPVIEHTCIITALPKGVKQLSNIIVRSKNGFSGVFRGPAVGLLPIYRGRIGYFRRNAPPAALTLTGPNSIFAPPTKHD